MANIEFSFVCKKTFNELEGDDRGKRFCDACSREVINFDVLTERQQQAYFSAAEKAGEPLCISATIHLPQSVEIVPCYKSHNSSVMGTRLGGIAFSSSFNRRKNDRKISEILSEFDKSSKS